MSDNMSDREAGRGAGGAVTAVAEGEDGSGRAASGSLTQDTSGRSLSPAALASLLVVGLLAVLVTLFLLFALPAVHSGPHHVPIGLVGDPTLVAGVGQGLESAQPGAFDAAVYDDEQALRDAILDREVYGGFVLDGEGERVLVASAAGPPVAQTLTAAGTALAAKTGMTAQTEDVRPLPADDPRGAGFTAVALPLTFGGLISAIALVYLFPRRRWFRAGLAVAFSLVAGAVLAVILKYWFGSVDGNVWAVGAGLALGMAAIVLAVLGLESVAGKAGLYLGIILMIPVANPLSGALSGPQWLPSGWGAFGQFLPPGANASLLRSTGFFDGAAALRPGLVLGAWVVLGLLLCGLAGLRQRRTTPVRETRSLAAETPAR